MRTYRVLSRLLSYPDEALTAALPDLEGVVASEAVLPPPQRAALGRLIDELGAGDLLHAQERYVGLFDRSRSLSLHLFEHVHGDSRDRGAAMVELIALYRRHGLDVSARELPDYLPLFLEFLSVLDPAQARPLLADAAHVLAAIRDRLERRASTYAAAFDALVFLAGAEGAPQAEDGDPDDSFDALDRAWEEAPVTFGPEGMGDRQQAGEGCSRVAGILARMNLAR
jgi:nitrate reductase delta subunit